MPDTQMLEQANSQRKHARSATFEAMKAKKPRFSDVEAVLNEGEEPVSFHFVAIPGPKYDALVTEHPPTAQQLKDDPNANVNGDTFPPALLARVCKDPELTAEQWGEIFIDPNWNRGELTSLYWEANNLCNRPLDLTPFGRG